MISNSSNFCSKTDLEQYLFNDAKAINVRVANENYSIRGPYVVFEIEYLWNGKVKKVWSRRQSSLIRLA